MIKKPELLAPAGNFERLKVALAYGADAVYMGGKQFGLRASADNFEPDEIKQAVDYVHKMGKKIYVTMNIFAHNNDFLGMENYVQTLEKIGVDAIIISDPGILMTVKSVAPKMDIHLSTQANTTNWKSAVFWYNQGVNRIIFARELSLNEFKHIRSQTPKELELEVFVHGAMCISYSGRCALSNYFTGRDANRGACSHPCRWKYHIVEEKRPGEYLPILEDQRGTYIFNSKDLCMIEHIPDLAQIGLDSYKIEGRMKSAYYVATVIQAYRSEIDRYYTDPDNYIFDTKNMQELTKASHRPFTTGFYYNKPTGEDHEYENSRYIREYDFIGMVTDYIKDEKLAVVEQRNNFSVGDAIEIMRPGKNFIHYKVEAMMDENRDYIENAPHPQQKLFLPIDIELEPLSLLRRIKE